MHNKKWLNQVQPRPKKETYIYLGLVMKLAGLQRDQVSIFPTLLTIAHIASLLGCSYSLSIDFFGGHLSTLVLSVFQISITTYTSHSQFQQFPKRPFAGTSTLPYIDSPEMLLETIIQDPMTSVLVSFSLNLQQLWLFWKRRTSVEQMFPQDWTMSKPVVLDWWLI